ncbi:MAG: DUF4255 domain-containing protein [Anaerolineae bacterium]|nr:DUF4255 domain-containing protein [Anaerolineae bacterium]
MIKSLDQTIKRILLEKGRFSPTDVDIRFDQPTRDWAAGLTRPAINCYLYDLRENRDLRSREWIVDQQPDGRAKKKLSPLRIDASYLITAWTNEVEDEHAVLWRVLVALSSVSILPEAMLEGKLVEQPFPIPAQTGQVSEAMTNLSDLWSVMENELKPAINYTVTLAVDREYAFDHPLVLTKRVDFRSLAEQSPVESVLQIAGIVHEQKNGAQPIADAEVTVVEHGQSVRTDRFGRYSFRNLPPGQYTFRVTARERQAEHRLTIPAGTRDLAMYDLDV